MSRYNGWANRATWLMHVNGFCDMFENYLSDYESAYDLANAMHETFENELEEALTSRIQKGLILDVISCADIDWDELAESIWIDRDEDNA